MPVAKPGCTPNAVLIMTGAKRTLLETLQRKSPEHFGNMSPSAIRTLARSPGPTAAWQVQGQVNALGHSLGIDPAIDLPTNRTSSPPSRITPAARPVFEMSVLVVERGATEGLIIRQIADYAAMRLFAPTDPKGLAGSPVPTIANILDAPMGTAIPATLTTWDIAFLRGLYASRKNAYAASQRYEIKRSITKELQREEEREAAPPQSAPTPRR
jgi:hypothetical protein